MKKHEVAFLAFTTLFSAGVSVITAVVTTRSLDDYASSLFSDSRYALLVPHTAPLANTSGGSLEHTRQSVHDALVVLTKGTVTATSFSSHLVSYADILGFGVILSSDGWVVSLVGDQGDVVWRDGARYEIVESVVDKTTGYHALRLANASNLPVAGLGDAAVLKSGDTLFAAPGFDVLFKTSLADARFLKVPGAHAAEAETVRWECTQLLASGTPLFSEAGELVGFTELASDGSSTARAIPLHHAEAFLQQTMRGATYAPPTLGAYVIDLSQAVNIDPVLRQDLHAGALVLAPNIFTPAVTNGGAADVAGIKVKDVIIAVDGDSLSAQVSLDELLSLYTVNQRVTLTVMRGGEKIDLQVTLQ